jgi:hypothetical protein
MGIVFENGTTYRTDQVRKARGISTEIRLVITHNLLVIKQRRHSVARKVELASFDGEIVNGKANGAREGKGMIEFRWNRLPRTCVNENINDNFAVSYESDAAIFHGD